MSYLDTKNSFIQTIYILAVRLKRKERAKPCKRLWTNLTCSYKEAPTTPSFTDLHQRLIQLVSLGFKFNSFQRPSARIQNYLFLCNQLIISFS